MYICVYMRMCRLMGPFIVMLGHIVGDVMRFLFLYAEIFIPYACSFWIIFGGQCLYVWLPVCFPLNIEYVSIHTPDQLWAAQLALPGLPACNLSLCAVLRYLLGSQHAVCHRSAVQFVPHHFGGWVWVQRHVFSGWRHGSSAVWNVSCCVLHPVCQPVHRSAQWHLSEVRGHPWSYKLRSMAQLSIMRSHPVIITNKTNMILISN